MGRTPETVICGSAKETGDVKLKVEKVWLGEEVSTTVDFKFLKDYHADERLSLSILALGG